MKKWEISSASTEYIPAKITAPHNPTSLSVGFAFTATDDLTGAIWRSAVWDGVAVLQDNGTYEAVAQSLVGAGGTVLAVGSYIVHVRVTDNPEIPAKKVGILEIY
jgi:hypothetical protein